MNTILHATFAEAEDGILALESLLYHGVRAEDITLILPKAYHAGQLQTDEPAEEVASMTGVQAGTSASALHCEIAVNSHSCVPSPPPLSRRPWREARGYYGDEDFMAPGAPGYRFDALGAVIPDSVPKKPLTSRKNACSEVVIDAEEGAGIGLGLGLVVALCLPGIGTIAGAGAIITSLLATGAVLGGLAGGIYGYLVDRGVAHGIALVMSNHLEAGGTTLSVTISDPREKGEVIRILRKFGGDLYQQL